MHIFHPIFSAKKSGEVIGMAAAGQSIKRRFRQNSKYRRKPVHFRREKLHWPFENYRSLSTNYFMGDCPAK
ncbi:hypothetical protein KC848_17050, partial [Enterobacter hormaechei]|uniref:hypothetical protein n=1 Tax=Enterobacter hormaechei TaxID=158836 RepID=UPI003316214F|nr:hypothetical protein [Enterobacter hormaechei]